MPYSETEYWILENFTLYSHKNLTKKLMNSYDAN